MRTPFVWSLALCFSVCAIADDVPGSGDNPLIPRYPGSEIINYTVSECDEWP